MAVFAIVSKVSHKEDARQYLTETAEGYTLSVPGFPNVSLDATMRPIDSDGTKVIARIWNKQSRDWSKESKDHLFRQWIRATQFQFTVESKIKGDKGYATRLVHTLCSYLQNRKGTDTIL